MRLCAGEHRGTAERGGAFLRQVGCLFYFIARLLVLDRTTWVCSVCLEWRMGLDNSVLGWTNRQTHQRQSRGRAAHVPVSFTDDSIQMQPTAHDCAQGQRLGGNDREPGKCE